MIKPKDGSCDLEIPKLQIAGERQNIVGKYYAIFSLFCTFSSLYVTWNSWR